MVPRLFAVLLGLSVGACAYPGAITGSAPVYAAGYQPVMGGYAASWPAQPGALWGPEDVPGIDVFFEPLAVHGRWIQTRWGRSFQPAAPRGWRPYVNGQWLDNRYWLSADPWGWATDHYGRWGFDDAIGWVWVPGTTWGPSWVAWREADEVVGWAPIPPQVNWNVGIGFGSGWGFDNWNSWYGPSWVFVPRNNLFVSRFGGRILPWNIGVNYWGRSRWQHTPYWGWNQPWDRGWGWRAPGYGGNNGNNRGWNNRGFQGGGQWQRPWNGNDPRNDPRRDWNGDPRRDWNGDPRRDWNGDPRRDWNGDPRRGQPGSVGDRIGRDLTGQPQQPRQGWNGGGRRDGVAVVPGRNGSFAGGDRRREGEMGRPGFGGRNQRAAPGGGVSGTVGGAMAPPQPPVQQPQVPPPQMRPQREPQMQRPQSQPQPQAQPAQNNDNSYGADRRESRERNRDNRRQDQR